MKRGLIIISCLLLLSIISLVNAEIRFEKDGDSSIKCYVGLKDSGTVMFNLLYGNIYPGTSFIGVGKNENERLVTSDTNSLLFFRMYGGNDYDRYFIASWSFPATGDKSESIILRATVRQDSVAGRNTTSIQMFVNGNWSEICAQKQKGDRCMRGNIEFTIDEVNYTPGGSQSVKITGDAYTKFDRVYDIEGNYFSLPLQNQLPVPEHSFDIFNSSGSLVDNWVAYWSADQRTTVRRNLPPFDSVEVVYAAKFTASPVSADANGWLTQLAKKRDGSIGNIEVLYGIVNLVKGATTYRQRFISLANAENDSIKEEFLYEYENTFYSYAYTYNSNGDPVLPSPISSVETRVLFDSGKKLVGYQLIEDYSQQLKAATLFNYFIPNVNLELVLNSISLYPQLDGVLSIYNPRPDANYWQADMSTFVQTGNPVIQ